MICFIFAGKSSDSEGLEAPSSVSNENISGNIDTPETVNILVLHVSSTLSKHMNDFCICPLQSLKLADLNLSENAEDLSSSISLWVFNANLFTSLLSYFYISILVGKPQHTNSCWHWVLNFLFKPQSSTLGAPSSSYCPAWSRCPCWASLFS